MDKLFLAILNMSLTASFVIAVVCLARVLLRRAPRIISYALWAVVLFNLVCPYKPVSKASINPVRAEPISQDILIPGQNMSFLESAYYSLTMDPLDDRVLRVEPDAGMRQSADGYGYIIIRYFQAWPVFGGYVWLIGMAATCYGATRPAI